MVALQINGTRTIYLINGAGPVLVAAVLDNTELSYLYLWMMSALLANVLISIDFFSKTLLYLVLLAPWKV